MRKFIIYLFSSLFLLIGAVAISPIDYLIPGLWKIYGTGHKTAFLEDFNYFHNTVVNASETPKDWPKHTKYNQLPLSEEIKKIHEQYRSVAFLIIYKDSLLHESYYEDYNALSKSNSFSMSKSMVSAMLGKAIEEGYLQGLNQKVSDFYPQYQDGLAAQLTLGDLSSMSSGLDWKEAYYFPINVTTESYFTEELETLMLSRDIIQQPGEKFVYLSGNTQILGMIIKKAVGKSLSQYFSESFWQPMNAMENALWQTDGEKNQMEKAFCCFASNAKDFARLGKLYKNHGKWGGKQLLDSAYTALSIQPRFKESPQYGYGFWLTQHQGEAGFSMRGHLGQHVVVFPGVDLIVVRLGHLEGPRKNAFETETFYSYVKEGFDMIQHVVQP